MKLDINGHEAYAYTGGKPFDSALPSLVLIHGAMNDHSVWTLLARSFAHHGYNVFAIDLPGHGRSEGPPLESVEACARWIWQWLDTAGVHDAAVAGHSMGSLIALDAASQQPERATKLLMVGTAYPMKVSDALLATARDTPLKAIDMVNAFSHSGWAAKPSYPGPGAWLQGGGRALMRRMQAGQAVVNLFEHDFKLCDSYARGLEAAAMVTCPVSLLLGERDQMTLPRHTASLVEALKPWVYKLPAGHALMAEAPEQMLTAMRQALG